MNVNPPPQVRQILYVLGVFINAVSGSLQSADVKLPVIAVALIAGYNAVIALMATANVSTRSK